MSVHLLLLHSLLYAGRSVLLHTLTSSQEVWEALVWSWLTGSLREELASWCSHLALAFVTVKLPNNYRYKRKLKMPCCYKSGFSMDMLQHVDTFINRLPGQACARVASCGHPGACVHERCKHPGRDTASHL